VNGTAKVALLILLSLLILLGNRTGLHLIQGFAATGVWDWSSLSAFGRFQLLGRGALVLLLVGGAAANWGRER